MMLARKFDEKAFSLQRRGDISTYAPHKAYMQGRVAADVAADRNAANDNQYIPKVMYTDPKVAVVGLKPKKLNKNG